MDARTECEVEQMNSEYSIRIPEKAIIQFLDDYDEQGCVVNYLLILNELYGKSSVETLIDCVYKAFYSYKHCFGMKGKIIDDMTIEEIKEYLRKRIEEGKMNDNYYPLNEDTYVDLVCLDDDTTKKFINWLRKKGLDSQEIVTNAIGCFAMITLLTDEEKDQISDVMGNLGDRLKKAIDEMTEGENDRTRNS